MSKRNNVLFVFLVSLLCACQKQYIYDAPSNYIPLESPKDTISSVTPLVVEPVEGVNIKTGVTEFKSLCDVNRAFDSKYINLRSNAFDPTQIIEQKMLVVPVYFTDSSVANDSSLRETKRKLINNAFFADETGSTYQSVASYYNRSSYGHLRLSGEVTPWISLEESSNDALNQGKNKPEDYVDKVVKK